MTLAPPPDQDIIVVGASGDLAQRKLIPALYNLHAENLLPSAATIVGVAPVTWDDSQFVEHARQAVREFSRTGIDDTTFGAFSKRLRFCALGQDGGFTGLSRVSGNDHRLFYLAVPPSAFGELIDEIGDAKLADGASIVIEKPFGHDRASAHALTQALHKLVPEERIYRIDHYLGKETVQNLLIFRFGNSMFERIWNRDAVARVEITVAEALGVETRGHLYEEIGAIRDIVQNHMFQVLALTAMEPPVSFEAEAIRNEKVKVLQSIHPLDPRDVVRGQYKDGTVEGQRVCAYREEQGVSAESVTETFAAMRLHLDTWRWSGVPFLLRTGKRLRKRDSRIVVIFHDVPLRLFSEVGVHRVDTNRLVIRIQPDEGIAVRFVAKQPGPDMRMQPVDMNFSYGESFKVSPPEAYERLLHDAMDGDHTLFIREDEVERGWAAVDRVLASPPPMSFYEAGSWGPPEADRIPAPGHWHNAEPDAEA